MIRTMTREAALFFVGSFISLRLGQDLGLRHRKRNGSEGIGGLATANASMIAESWSFRK
jgi:hypothetical protein